MILTTPDAKIETSGDLQTQNFQIATCRKAFEILSSGLYSDKIGAVIRELSTNAADSQMENGVTQPFKVHLPNSFEPWFSVADYGTGMAEEHIMKLYTTYFASNRTRSNQFTGCLGLGSKSPFAYSDNFNIESRFEGTKTLYTCIIGTEGTPVITKMQAEKTTEPTGVEVRLAVNPIDFQAFKTKAKAILSWFKPRPEVTGAADFRWQEQRYLFQDNEFGIQKDRTNISRVIMGNVAYTLDRYQLLNHKEVGPEEHGLILEQGVDLFIPIGSVEISANREQLGYTVETKKYLADVLKRVRKALKDNSAKIIDAAPSLWDARKLVYSYRHSLLNGFIGNKPLWRGLECSHTVNRKHFKNAPAEVNELHVRMRSLKRMSVDYIEADHTPIVINDIKAGICTRVGSYLRANKLNNAYIISNDIEAADINDTRPDFKDTGVYEAAIKASTLPKPPPTPRNLSGSLSPTTQLLKFIEGKNNDQLSWENHRAKLKDGGVYLVVNRYRSLHSQSHGSWHYHTIGNILTSLRELGEPTTLFGIRPSVVPKLEKYKAVWKELESVIRVVLRDNKPLREKASLVKEWAELHNPTFVSAICRKGNFDPQSPFGIFAAEIQKSVHPKTTTSLTAYLYLADLIKFQVVAGDRLEKLRQKTWDKYPLLDIMNLGNWTYDQLKPIIEYIRAIDADKLVHV